MPDLAPSAQAVHASRIRELAEIAMTMDDVLKLYFGESNLPTPEFIKRAAQKAMQDGFTYYTSNAGLVSTRKAIAEYYERTHSVAVDRGNVLVTGSGVQALNLSIRCLLDPGDEAIVLTPAWPNGSAIVQMCSATPVQVPHVIRGNRFGVDWDALEAAVTPRTRMLLYTSPSNPLGWSATDEEQTRILDFARRHNLWLMADEVYDRLHYALPGPAPTILRKTHSNDAVVVIQSFSKAWCMTGWRLGWMIGRSDLITRAIQLNEFVISHANSFVQRAGESALAWGENTVREMVAQYRANRDYVLGRLRAMPGLTVPEPEGAFYVFPKVEGLTDSFEFCRELLLKTKVGLAPGVAFGAGGEGSVRICYASDMTVLEPAMERLGEFLSARQTRRAAG